MASLNEIKIRRNSVESTKKITSAMMMIASAKLNKVQSSINNFLPYQKKLDEVLMDILASDSSFDSVYLSNREIKKCAIIAFSSNSSLCGIFNSNIIKTFLSVYRKKTEELGKENVLSFPIGKKIYDALAKMQIKAEGNFNDIAEQPSFEDVATMARKLTKMYLDEEVDEVIIIYTHFISTSRQEIDKMQFLPFDLSKTEEKEKKTEIDYIFDPSKNEILESLIPKVLNSRMFAVSLNSNASEHASRMIAMQTATDNAKKLNEDLTIQYNKQRQQAITNELLDIISGANAVKS